MGFVSRLLEFGACVVAGFVTGLLNPALVPVATSVVSLVRKYVSGGRFDDVRDEIIELVKGGKIPVGTIVDVVRHVLEKRDVRDVVFKELRVDVDVPLVLDQFSFYCSGVDRGFYDEFLRFRDVILSELGRVRRFVSYFHVPRSVDEVRDFWRLPKYIDGVLFRSSKLENVLGSVWDCVSVGENVVIVGDPGVGKTVALYASLLDLFYRKGLNVGVLLHGGRVGRVHEEEGFVLFLDDAPKHGGVLECVYHNSVRNIVATARSVDWRELDRRLRESFSVVVLEPLGRDEIEGFIDRYSDHFGIVVDDDARSVIVDRCHGSPIYVRYLFEDAARRRMSRITRDFVVRVPDEMYEYVASIIGDVLYDVDRRRSGAYGVALTLRVLGDLRDCRVCERVLDKVFGLASDEARRVFGDVVDFDLYLRMKDYLARDPELGSIGFPHDIWADIIVRKNTKHRVAKLISLVESRIPYKRRARIIRDAFRQVLEEVEYEYKIHGSKVAKDKFSVAYYVKLNKDIIGDILEEKEVRREAENYSNLTVSRLYLISTPPSEKKVSEVTIFIGDQKYRIRAGEIEIGRNPHGANIQIRYAGQIIDTPIMDMTVSRKHLKIFVEGKKIFVMDLGSRNGTWIDSKQLKPNEKIGANEVRIGGQNLRLKIKAK